jgi:hypothetical protein
VAEQVVGIAREAKPLLGHRQLGQLGQLGPCLTQLAVRAQ